MGYTESQARAFINEIAPLMQAESRKRGYNVCSTAIAQAIIEGACGTSKLASPPYNNHFGLKCGSYWTGRSVNMKTKEEYVVGSPVTIKDNFRCYDSMADCVKGYYDFINTKRYANLKDSNNNYVTYAIYLKADGYATSSTYVATLVSTVEKYQLYTYDLFTEKKHEEKPKEETKNGFIIGKTYTLCANLYIRESPNGNKIDYNSITTNAQLNAYTDDKNCSILRKGTKVTCKDTSVVNDQVWVHIPSGWIIGKDEKKVYIA